MDAQLKSLLVRLETRTRQLVLAYTQLAADYDSLQHRLVAAEEEQMRLREENVRLQQMYDHLKMAKYIDLCDDDKRLNRQRINKMVREIDKCIAMLKTTASDDNDE